MKKSILNLGLALNREEQKEVFGGNIRPIAPNLCNEGQLNSCETDADCCGSESCLPDWHVPGGNGSNLGDDMINYVGGDPNNYNTGGSKVCF